MVRNGLGVDARRGRVRAASATQASVLVVLDDAPFVDTGEAMRVALASARAKFGEPEAIALVHDDDLPAAELELLRTEARSAGVGDVLLVPDSVARPFADGRDVAATVAAATGAAIWLLRDRRGVVVPPILPTSAERDERGGEEGTRSMDDFGKGRRMLDFNAGRAVGDFGAGSAMSDFGDGAQMDDFGTPERKRGSRRLIVAAIAAVLLIAGGAVAASGVIGGTTDVDSVASTDTTATEAADDAEPATSTTAGDAGADTSTTSAAADNTTTTLAAAAPETTLTTSAPAASTTTIASTARTYDVTAIVESFASDEATPRLQQGDRALGTVTLSCNESGDCEGSVVVPEWNLTHGFTGVLVNGTLDHAATFQPQECSEAVEATFTFGGAFDDTSSSGRLAQTFKPRGCTGADGTPVSFEDIVVSFS